MYTGFPSAVLVVVCVERCRVDAYPLDNECLGPWGEAEEVPVWAPLGDVHIHQGEEVSRIVPEPLARDGLPAFLPLFVAAEK